MIRGPRRSLEERLDDQGAEEESEGEVGRSGGHHSAHSCLVVVMDAVTAGIRGRNRRELLFADDRVVVT